MGVEAQSLVWGMSSWHSDFDFWTSKLGNVAGDYPDCWTTGDPPALPSYTMRPMLETVIGLLVEAGPVIVARQREQVSARAVQAEAERAERVRRKLDSL